MIMGVLLYPFIISAHENDAMVDSIPADRRNISDSANTDKSHFAWGAEFGISVDMSGYDSSTFNVDAMAGYRNSYLHILGLGAGIHRSIGSGDNYVPLYAIVRTSFSKRPRLLFMNLKIGYSFNTIGDAPTFGDTNASIGAGITLASGKTYRSYIILGYEFRHFTKRNQAKVDIEADDVSLVSLSFGVNF